MGLIKFCYENCPYLNITEREQSRTGKKIKHKCNRYNKPLWHREYHPELIRLDECNITAIGGRRSGKTLQLIKECAENGGTMICHNAESKRLINDLADSIGVKVEIISVGE